MNRAYSNVTIKYLVKTQNNSSRVLRVNRNQGTCNARIVGLFEETNIYDFDPKHSSYKRNWS